MKKTIRIASLALAVAMATLGCTAQADQTTDKLKATLQARLGNDAPIKSVSKSPVAGLYEVNLGSQIIYSDAAGDYVLLGDLVDAKTHKNLTDARLVAPRAGCRFGSSCWWRFIQPYIISRLTWL